MKLEQQLLPHTDLAPLYDKAVWLYNYQTFENDEAGRAADRVALRFGVTSWPQLMLANPYTLARTVNTGRSVASFERAFAAGGVEPRDDKAKEAARLRYETADTVARKLTETRDVPRATAALLEKGTGRSDDIVVRSVAAKLLAEEKPALLVDHAAELLATPSDPFRYLVLQALAKAGDAKAAPHLEKLVKDPQPSMNPNVVRIRAVQALAACGRKESIAVIAPHATSGVYFNGLTGIAVDTLAKLAARDPALEDEVARILRTGYPKVPTVDPDSKMGMRHHRAATALARRIHKAVRDPRSFPKPYDEAARTLLMTAPDKAK